MLFEIRNHRLKFVSEASRRNRLLREVCKSLERLWRTLHSVTMGQTATHTQYGGYYFCVLYFTVQYFVAKNKPYAMYAITGLPPKLKIQHYTDTLALKFWFENKNTMVT